MRLLLLLFVAILATSSARAEEVAPPLTARQFMDVLPSEDEKELDAEGFKALQAAGPVTVLDLRSPESFAHLHLKGAVNAPLTELTEKTLPGFVPQKDAPVVLVCDASFQPTRRVAMTMQAYPVLKAQGYTRIHRLNLWREGENHVVPLEDVRKIFPFEGTDIGPAPQ